MRHCACAIVCCLFLALATPAMAGPPEAWWRISYNSKQADFWLCQSAANGNGPLDFMRLADLERGAYHMEDVTEQGQVVETSMVTTTRYHPWYEPTPREGRMTWYRGKTRCDNALRALREAAQQERQRREKYR
jgi:hypothetical protein